MLPPHTLLLRFALVNIVALGLVLAALVQGWLSGFAEPLTWVLSLGITMVFLWGLSLAGFRVVGMDKTFATLASGRDASVTPHRELFARLEGVTGEERALQTDMARMSFGHQIAALRYIANSLVFLGLIGTVIGFIIGLSGIDAQATKNVDKIAPMITDLINGMSVALYTTLLGAVLNIWLNINIRIVSDGAVRLLGEMVDRSNARAPSSAVAASGASA